MTFERALGALTASIALVSTSATIALAQPNDEADPRLVTFARQIALSAAFSNEPLPRDLRLPDDDPVWTIARALRAIGSDTGPALQDLTALEERLGVEVARLAAAEDRSLTDERYAADLAALREWSDAAPQGNARLLRKALVVLRLLEARLRLEETLFEISYRPATLGAWDNIVFEASWRAAAEYRFVPVPFRLPCAVIGADPNAAVDAFGDLSAYPSDVTVTDFFDCPVPRLFSGRPEAEDFVLALEVLRGDVDRADVLAMIPQPDPPRVRTPSAPEPRPPEEPDATLEAFRRALESGSPEEAATVVSESGRAADRLLLALLYHAFPERLGVGPSDVQPILADLAAGGEGSDYAYISPEQPYDGTAASMVEHLLFVYAVSPEPLHPIPCAILEEAPGLLATFEESGVSIDPPSPRHDCRLEQHPVPPSVAAYLEQVKRPWRGWSYTGTSTRSQYARERHQALVRHVFPSVLVDSGEVPSRFVPFETWSMLSLSNRRVFETLAEAYRIAKRDLSVHYAQAFDLSDSDAAIAAELALQAAADAGHWDDPPQRGLRRMILDGAPADAIRAEIERAGDVSRVPFDPLRMGYYEHGWSYTNLPDPLIMVAVHRPDVLAVLLDAPNSSNGSDDPEAYVPALEQVDLRTSPNAANWFGKTPLMAAAQIGNAESVRILLRAGADPARRTLARAWKGYDDDFDRLVHDLRTAAMYAALDGDAETLDTLLDADPRAGFAIDSTGLRPLHYLLGYLGGGANDRLFNAEMVDQARALNTFVGEVPVASVAPSFDCTRAAGEAERIICNDELFAVYDRLLDQAYRRAASLLEADEEAVDDLRRGQVDWLRMRNDCTSSDEPRACLVELYESRIEVLRRRERVEGRVAGHRIGPEGIGFALSEDSWASVLW